MYIDVGTKHRGSFGFPPEIVSNDGRSDPLLERKLKKGTGQWKSRTDILRWLFNGAPRCIELPHNQKRTNVTMRLRTACISIFFEKYGSHINLPI